MQAQNGTNELVPYGYKNIFLYLTPEYQADKKK